MQIVREAKVGDKLWLGETQYELTGVVRDAKNKVVPNSFVAEPVAWSDRILSLPENIRKFVKKTEAITIVFPLKVWEDAK